MSTITPTYVYNTYLLPVFAAGAAIPLAMPLLERKSAQQTEGKLPEKGGVYRGISASPVIAKIIGTQKVVQNLTALGTEKALGWKEDELPSIASSAFLGAVLTSNFYADFNKKTMTGEVRPVTLSQRGIIVAREMPFLAIEPVCKAMKKDWGGSLLSDTGCAFASGVLGSLSGHAQDTTFSRMQKGLPITLASLPKGIVARSVGLGIFQAVYEGVKTILKA